MNKYYILFLLIFLSTQLKGQENDYQDKVTLNTGEVFIGKIVLKTKDLIMLTTKIGTRYQFQVSEIKRTESEQVKTNVVSTNKNYLDIPITKSTFAGMVELTAGMSNAKNCFNWSPNTQLSLLFGNRHTFGQDIFLGAGIGYNSTYNISKSQYINFLPLFARIQSSISKNRTSPYFGMDLGYGIGLNSGYKGGFQTKVSVGITHKISYKTIVFIGLNAGVQSFSTILEEQNELGTFKYNGKTTINTIGAKVGLIF
jgi:hypothetical protein